MSSKSLAILFVCMGNICRSPALAGTLQEFAKKKGIEDLLYIDSCAITDWFVGARADARMNQAAHGRGISLDDHRAKIFESFFFVVFDLILAVDDQVLRALEEAAPSVAIKKKIHLATAFSQNYLNQGISDPYYGDAQSFEHVMDMAEDACSGIIKKYFSR
ncbi:MAG: low molecular weight protein-tyrosine-phosphatase [Anaerolineae bacterium]